MARYTGPATKKSRRLGVDLKGNDKNFDKRPFPPGDHGRGRIKESEYLLQLREKQKARYYYGVLEKQFRRYYEEASRRTGLTGENLLVILETRLDNVVFRGGFARTRREARQLVSHKHVSVNGRTVNIPSYAVKVGDVVEIRERARNSAAVLGSLELYGRWEMPGWIESDPSAHQIKILSMPERAMIDAPVQEQMIVELYSK
ncbi:MAG TPA: 30S ribosomal protein S4 [Nitriliruptoraceae bacterium]|nr:30S ribosomal protein S4 [Nitriliruptoraceae bacterium]